MQKPFFEPHRHVGGCTCPAWTAAWEQLRAAALDHPLCSAREAEQLDDDAKAEAVDHLAEELAQGLHGPPPVFMIDTSLCRHPDRCRRSNLQPHEAAHPCPSTSTT